MSIDIAIFYFMTPLNQPEFVKIRLSDIPEEVIQEYNLQDKATPASWVYIYCIHGMYCLPQASSRRDDCLEECLNTAGYQQNKIVPILWKHKTQHSIHT